MQHWLERARATVPKRALKRVSSDLPTLEDLGAHSDYLRGLLAEDPSMGYWKLREAMKTKGFLVTESIMQRWLKRYHEKCKYEAPIEGLPVVDREGLLPYEAQLLQFLDSKTGTTYMQAKEFLEQRLGATCSLNTMIHWMQAPFRSLPMVSIDELSSEEHFNFLKAVYSVKPHISLYALRVKLGWTFKCTASNDTMRSFSLLRHIKRQGLGRRLHKKTSPPVAAVPHITPYLDKLYEEIANNPSITVQGLSELFLSEYGKFFDVEQLRAATSRLKRRHAIFKAWQSELDLDFGVRREEGLVKPPSNIGSMSEHDFSYCLMHASFAIVADCGHSLRLGVRLYLVTTMHLIRRRKPIRYRIFVGRLLVLLLLCCIRREPSWTPTNYTIRRSFPIGLSLMQPIVSLR